MEKAVVLFSGGLDSAVTLAQAKAMGYECYALGFDYGQRHKIELGYAARLCVRLGVKFTVCIVHMGPIKCALLDKDAEITDAASCYVPGRNLIFLSQALQGAFSLGTAEIFIGANADDYGDFPDTRLEFFTAFEKLSSAINYRVRIQAPLLTMSKRDIAKLTEHYKIKPEDTWSCYDPQEHFVIEEPLIRSCGKCPACKLRAKAYANL